MNVYASIVRFVLLCSFALSLSVNAQTINTENLSSQQINQLAEVAANMRKDPLTSVRKFVTKSKLGLISDRTSGACRQNERWTRGTVGGVSTVLPGLVTRAGANADLCESGL